MSMKVKESINSLMYLCISIFCLYTIWFQYAFFPIGGLLNFVGAIMVILILLSVLKISQITRNSFLLLLFLMICFVSSIVMSKYRQVSMNSLFRILKYCIPMVTITLYSDKAPQNIFKVFKIVFISCLFLAIFSFITDIFVVTYEVQVAGKTSSSLNTNVFSCYMMLGAFSACILLVHMKKNISVQIILFISIFIELIAQLNAASRRGIVVFVFLIISYVYSDVFVNRERSVYKKIVVILLCIIILGIVVVNFDLLTEKFVGIQRLLGNSTKVGDSLREKYQHAALLLFKESPILGNGLNSVAISIGMYSHSFYYELLATTGLLGTIIMIYFIIRNLVLYIKATYVNNEINEEDRMLSSMCVFGLISLLICGIAVVMIYDSWFYIMIGLIVALNKKIGIDTPYVELRPRQD